MKINIINQYQGKVELENGKIIHINQLITRDLINKYYDELYTLTENFINTLIGLPISYTEQLLDSKDLRKEFYDYENNRFKLL